MFEMTTLIALVLFMTLREYLHFRQVIKLEELLKSIDVTEYYKARNIDKQMQKPISEKNPIMDEPNDLPSFDQNFDIGKITQVNIDGEDHPVDLI